MKLRYSLSHIFLLVTIVALICGWNLDRTQFNKRYRANQQTLLQIITESKQWESDMIRMLYAIEAKDFHALNIYDQAALKQELDTLRDANILYVDRLNRIEIK